MATILKAVNTAGTLKLLGIGESVTIPYKAVYPSTVRANASRLRKSHGMDFKITQNTKECKTTVTRIK